MTPNENLFVALRGTFPMDLDAVAIETADEPPLRYTWSDLERGTAMLANLLASMELPLGSRIAVQAEESVEALMLYLAVLRAGWVYLPFDAACLQDEMTFFMDKAEPAMVVCTPKTFSWVSRLAFAAGAWHVFTLDASRGGSLLQRAALQSDRNQPAQRASADLAAMRCTGASEGAMLSHGDLRRNWAAGDASIHTRYLPGLSDALSSSAERAVPSDTSAAGAREATSQGEDPDRSVQSLR